MNYEYINGDTNFIFCKEKNQKNTKQNIKNYLLNSVRPSKGPKDSAGEWFSQNHAWTPALNIFLSYHFKCFLSPPEPFQQSATVPALEHVQTWTEMDSILVTLSYFKFFSSTLFIMEVLAICPKASGNPIC